MAACVKQRLFPAQTMLLKRKMCIPETSLLWLLLYSPLQAGWGRGENSVGETISSPSFTALISNHIAIKSSREPWAGFTHIQGWKLICTQWAKAGLQTKKSEEVNGVKFHSLPNRTSGMVIWAQRTQSVHKKICKSPQALIDCHEILYYAFCCNTHWI